MNLISEVMPYHFFHILFITQGLAHIQVEGITQEKNIRKWGSYGIILEAAYHIEIIIPILSR